MNCKRESTISLMDWWSKCFRVQDKSKSKNIQSTISNIAGIASSFPEDAILRISNGMKQIYALKDQRPSGQIATMQPHWPQGLVVSLKKKLINVWHMKVEWKKSLFTDRGGIRDDIPSELRESFNEIGKILESFSVPYLKKIIYSAMYHAYNINRPWQLKKKRKPTMRL